MSDITSLIKENPLLPAEDFVALRRQGISAIERLSNTKWTDYNTSDPGITILEAVCYAITDLSYRTGFDLKDLLAPAEPDEDTWKQVFYTARQLLHNSALTITDYRKLIIDVAGVRNAWIVPSKDYELPIWVDYQRAIERTVDDCSCDHREPRICIGQLSLYPWDESEEQRAATKALMQALMDKLTAGKKSLKEQEAALAKLTDPAAIFVGQESIKKTLAELDQINAELEKLRAAGDTTRPAKIVELEGLYNVMIAYEEDVLEEEKREEVRQMVIDRLQGHRNLCEDFLSINAVEYEDFGIGASIELEEWADPDVVLAQLFFVIYRYFTPSVPFHTIEQLQTKGFAVEDIFDGPALKHGFLNSAEVEATDLFRDIRMSDLINEISDIPGLKAILYLHLPFNGFDDEKASRDFFNEWVNFLTEERKIARIQPTMSSVMFCKERDFITYQINPEQDRNPARMLKLFRDLKAAERQYKLIGVPLDFPVPEGEYMDLQDYYPISYSLPNCYGVNDQAGLPQDASELRKIQALQLKGYLLFFEQLLSDHLVQLDHLRDLFTFDERLKTTRHTRVLKELEDLKLLLADHGDHGADHYSRVLADFKEVLENITETPQQFLLCRNRSLDHMLARYSEDMSAYERIVHSLFPYKAGERLMKDKTRMLAGGEYFQISTDRAQGYNYAKMQYWDTLNVSGTERRVSRLLGFSSAERRTLAPDYILVEPVIDAVIEGQKKPRKERDPKYNIIKLTDPDNRELVLLTSVRAKDGCCTDALTEDILAHADDRKYFVFHDERKQQSRKTAGVVGNFWFELFDDTDPLKAVSLASSDKFNSQEQRDKTFRRLQKVMNRINDNEGLHLVEHLLLRPKMDSVSDERGMPIEVALLDICLDSCDLNIGLDERTERPVYRKKISRTPAEKCYDQMPWILAYLRANPLNGMDASVSMLYQEAFDQGDEPRPLKFRTYDALVQRVRELQEFGSERASYELVRSSNETTETTLYSFIIRGSKNRSLAQSPFIFHKQSKTQQESGTTVENDIEQEIDRLIRYFGFELDLYCDEDPCDHHEDPYSFRTTAVLPCWPKRFREPTFRNLVEKTILATAPAHIHTRIVWVGIAEMRRFEEAYANWLLEMAQTEAPVYDKVNPLIYVLNTLKACGVCDEDCAGPAEPGRMVQAKTDATKE